MPFTQFECAFKNGQYPQQTLGISILQIVALLQSSDISHNLHTTPEKDNNLTTSNSPLLPHTLATPLVASEDFSTYLPCFSFFVFSDLSIYTSM